jgi:hypothetical protein
MSHLALFKHETQAIKNPPPTFQTFSLGTWVNDTNPSVRIHQNPKGLRNGRKRDRSLPIAGTLS